MKCAAPGCWARTKTRSSGLIPEGLPAPLSGQSLPATGDHHSKPAWLNFTCVESAHTLASGFFLWGFFSWCCLSLVCSFVRSVSLYEYIIICLSRLTDELSDYWEKSLWRFLYKCFMDICTYFSLTYSLLCLFRFLAYPIFNLIFWGSFLRSLFGFLCMIYMKGDLFYWMYYFFLFSFLFWRK